MLTPRLWRSLPVCADCLHRFAFKQTGVRVVDGEVADQRCVVCEEPTRTGSYVRCMVDVQPL